MRAKLIKDHLYTDVYGYRGREIWISSEANTIRKPEKLFFYYIDGNCAVTDKILLPWYPRFQTRLEAIEHAEKRINNIQLETELLKKLA